MDTSRIDLSTRNGHEISVNALKAWFGGNKTLFKDSVTAVIADCVKEYRFDAEKQNFVGIVESLYRTYESYEVKV